MLRCCDAENASVYFIDILFVRIGCVYLDVVSCHLNVDHIFIYFRRFSADVQSFAPVVSCIYSLSSKTLEEGTKSRTTRMD